MKTILSILISSWKRYSISPICGRDMTLVEIRRYKRQNWKAFGSKPNQFIRARADRSATTQKLGILLQRKRSVLLQTPRWSGGRAFCREFCKLHANAQYVPLQCPSNIELHEAWMFFLEDFRRIFALPSEERLQIIAERKGFRWKLVYLFEQLPTDKVLIFDQIERWPVTLIEDVQRAWKEYSYAKQEHLVLILAGAIQGGVFTNRLWLNDYSLEETNEVIQRELQRPLSDEEEKLVHASGGVPDLVLQFSMGMCCCIITGLFCVWSRSFHGALRRCI